MGLKSLYSSISMEIQENIVGMKKAKKKNISVFINRMQKEEIEIFSSK